MRDSFKNEKNSKQGGKKGEKYSKMCFPYRYSFSSGMCVPITVRDREDEDWKGIRKRQRQQFGIKSNGRKNNKKCNMKIQEIDTDPLTDTHVETETETYNRKHRHDQYGLSAVYVPVSMSSDEVLDRKERSTRRRPPAMQKSSNRYGPFKLLFKSEEVNLIIFYLFKYDSIIKI